MIDSAPRPDGPRHRLRAAWWIFACAVVGNAVIQGLLVVGDPIPATSVVFAVLVLASLASLTLGGWVVVSAWSPVGLRNSGAADGTGTAPPRRIPTLAWSLGVLVAAVLAGIVHPLLAPLPLLFGLFVLPPVAAGARRPIAAGFRPVRHQPLRYLLAALGFVVVVLLSWGAAVALGLFVYGFAAALVLWLWIGTWTVLFVGLWSALYRRAGRVDEDPLTGAARVRAPYFEPRPGNT